MMDPGGVTLFRQTFILLIGTLIVAHLAGFFIVILQPNIDSDTTALSDIALQLASPDCDKAVPAMAHVTRLQLTQSSEPPVLTTDMQSDTLLQTQLASTLGVPDTSVRLAWIENSEIRLKRVREIIIDKQAERIQEALFLRKHFFARKWPEYWCVGQLPSEPWYAHWQAVIALTLFASFVVLLCFSWLFARRLSQPMHYLATAINAAGRNNKTLLLETIGPKEMRIAARALNAMQARIQEQLREREAMVAAIAHDLRTPLSRIAFRVEAASLSVSDSVQHDIEQMKAMITSTLDYFSEGQQPRGNERIDLKQLLEGIIEGEQVIGHCASMSCDQRSFFVNGDEVQLNRLFQNLVDNACKFGGVAEVSLYEENNNVIVSIADHGPGIDSDQIDEMFRPFSRGEPSRNSQTGGTGLGLSIARSIVEKYSGEIALSNRQGGGLLVTVKLPIANAFMH